MELKKTNFALLGIIIVLFIVAVLVLIKVLFLDAQGFEWGSVTDWVSAACNMAMAGAAVYAAYNAKDWISPKIQHEGFKQASMCMAEMIQLRILQQHLLASYRLIIKPENNATPNDLLDNFKRHNELWQDFSKKVIDYGTRCEGLKIWKIYVLQTDKFHTLISHLSKTNKIHSKIISSFNMDDGIYIVLQKWQQHKSDIEEVHKSLADSIKSLTVDFDTLFK
ncbi:hypothetical protein QTN38_006925 [Enterobacter cloacae subsp. cloacae]|jgi:hypothetical protein|uniref:hypothetical protein n=1 Tax=Enterobacter cloacae TaxID=550 RepID=UPI0019824559|nr:hypothetical protein [Enterobacter cloacae]MBN4757390.1 hypothetical protein [Enterobacter cloacae]MCT2765726.1 hypothetical protein [Enterobacter cloacae]MCU6309140.1 hypothetical protein [Enterobacter cloacae]MDR1751985.1 hypothetical protein [Enterobacter cloacae]WLD33409.1 hypothetical protein QTN38_006925 [Enterobacter cloacae subsp. cloacae]